MKALLPEENITIAEAARRLRLKPYDVVELIDEGGLGSVTLVSAASLAEYRDGALRLERP